MGDARQLQVNGKGKAKNDYNSWNMEESKMLLQLMVDAVSHGWRNPNGVLNKATVEAKILPKINKKLKCQKSYSHYQSRLKYFKKKYQKYTQLVHHCSRFEWDPIKKKFIGDEKLWEDYFKSYPSHIGLRIETCEDYEELQIVFGNEIAIERNSLELGDDIDARIDWVKDRHVGKEEFVYDDGNKAFLPNEKEPSHQDPSPGQSSSPLLFHATSPKVPSESINQKKRTRAEYEGNTTSFETTNQAGILEKLSLSIDSIATNFQRICNLLEKREKDREKRKRENQSCIWDAIKETPNLDERARYKAVALLNTKTRRDVFFSMSLEERSDWITYLLK
ncbi:hypothetical protein L3X38_023032 [Prunus dulcis]|uniref:Myb/SANT-like domain-containing protein n=1 Tax=Prunus dulcis TaxID=3755 RepID=A0AAD4Z5R8_PRUDU|nr:hypothetical protein L3X38_023032 [Prunus dulcis]